MGNEKEKSRITIHLDAPYVLLRGTSGAGASDAEPGFLSGHVSLYLTESTDLRAVTLHLRGKARIPVPPSESLINAPFVQTVVVCSHDWSFLDFESSPSPHHQHTRTLKAGKHIFPFSLTLSPALPSSLTADLQSTLAFSTSFTGTRALISYKLRAIAARPSFSSSLSSFSSFKSHHPLIHILQHNLTTTHPVYLIRAPSPESLEYQQSVEVENTWPDKLMYSITLPHKAWAAGDTILAVLRFSPLAKGVWVESVVTTLWESVEILAAHQQQNRQHKVVHQESRIVGCVKHEIVNGRAVRVDLSKPPKWALHHAPSPPSQCERPTSSHHHDDEPSSNSNSSHRDGLLLRNDTEQDDEEFRNHDVVTYITFPLPSMPHDSKPIAPTRMPSMPGSNPSSRPPTPTDSTQVLTIPFASTPPSASMSVSHTPSQQRSAPSPPPTHHFSPLSLTPPLSPTHRLPPIHISHRLRLSILIHNRDGHTSELRCSLPVNILDGKVLFDSGEGGVALAARRVCVESVIQGRRRGTWREREGTQGGQSACGAGEGVDTEGEGAEDDLSQVLGFNDSALYGGPTSVAAGAFAVADRDLPSYHAHLRDRVAMPGVEFGGSALAPVGTTNGNGNEIGSPVQVPQSVDTLGSAGVGQGSGSSRSPNLNPAANSNSNVNVGTGITVIVEPVVESPVDDLVDLQASRTNTTANPTTTPTTTGRGSLLSVEYINSKLMRRHSHSYTLTARNDADRDRNRSHSHSHAKRPSTSSGVDANAGGLTPSLVVGDRDAGEGNAENGRPSGRGQAGKGHGHARNLSTLIRATMRPFASLGLHSPSSSSHGHGQHQHQHHGHGLFGFTRSASGSGPGSRVSSQDGHVRGGHTHGWTPPSSSSPASPSANPQTTDPNSNFNTNPTNTTARSLSQVPTYTTASLATYLGGVQPLSSLVGLPSYDDVVSVHVRRVGGSGVETETRAAATRRDREEGGSAGASEESREEDSNACACPLI